MFFTVNTKSDPELAIARIKLNARRKIMFYPEHANEQLLDEYIIKNYKTKLKLMCLKIITNANYSIGNKDEIVITIPDRRLDNIATLITYGNEKLPGSNILKVALSN